MVRPITGNINISNVQIILDPAGALDPKIFIMAQMAIIRCNSHKIASNI